MESGRLDLESATAEAEVNGTKESVATYKSLPDDDSNWQTNNKQNVHKNTMGKQNEDIGLDDDAQEKMLNDDSNIVVTAKEPTEVKFISENGDAKIDIETVKTTLSGMGKEELMKYANDPFWIRLRWFLFASFWLIWVGMLAGAVALIVMAPRCSAPEPKKWWEESPILQLDADDIEGRDVKSIETLLDSIKDQHVKVLSLSNFVGVNGHTKDFRDVQSKVGDIKNFDAIVKAAKDREQHIVLELDPNHSSLDHPWFEYSVKRDDKYTDYYVWADGKTEGDIRKPPNNWMSITGGPAWEWNNERGQYYLHQFKKTQPDFNFRNPSVVAEFSDILSHWLDRGVSGFRLGDTQYLIEDPSLVDEGHSATGANIEEYSGLTHAHTKDYPENADVLNQWRELVMNRTKSEGLFTLRDNIGADVLAVYNQQDKKKLIDLPQSSTFLETADASITAAALLQGVEQSLNTSGGWPTWDLNGNEANLRERMPEDVADSLVLMTLLLPGTPIVKLNDTRSSKETTEAFSTIAKARTVQTFLYGQTETSLVNGTVFVYTRLKSGHPGYLVAYQSSDEFAYIDVSNLKSVPAEMNVLAHSANYVQKDGPALQKKLPSDRLPMFPKSTLVVTFVPKEK